MGRPPLRLDEGQHTDRGVLSPAIMPDHVDPRRRAILARILAGVKSTNPLDHHRASTVSIEACDPQLLLAYDGGYRVRVVNDRDHRKRTGRVSRSLGFQPVLLLMGRANQLGSSDVLGPDDRVTAIQRPNGKYEDVL